MARRSILLLAFVLVFSLAGTAHASEHDTYPYQPDKAKGAKKRIGYYEGGPYSQYTKTLLATVISLARLGWMDPVEIPEFDDVEDAKAIWDWLADNVKSPNIVFVKEAFWSADWEDAPREKMRKDCLAYLKKGKLDLIIAMGTWAGNDLAVPGHKVPTVVMSSSDPLGSGIIKSLEDSGLDQLHARIDPDRYLRQVRLFHDIVGFNRLGIVYEDTVAGRSYAALDDVQTVAKERGFKIEACTTKLDVNAKEAYDNLLACHKQLAGRADAIYLTENGGMQYDKFGQLMAPIYDAKMPSFSQAGSEEVMYGVLLSIAQAGMKYIGEYHAKIIGQILNGAQPRKLSMVFEEPPKIAINLKTAEIIDFDPPVDILMAADEIYEDIQTVQ